MDSSCVHANATDTIGIVRCGLNLFGGTPHTAICGQCRKRIPILSPEIRTISPTANTGKTQSAHLGRNFLIQPHFPQNALLNAVYKPKAASTRRPRNGETIVGDISTHQRNLLLRMHLSPGDVVMLSAAVRDLHRAYPTRFVTAVDTTASELWLHNPYVVPKNKLGIGAKVIEMAYPLINKCNQRPYHFIHGFVQFLEERLGLDIPVTEFKGDIYLSAADRETVFGVDNEIAHKGRVWIMMAGGKYDFTAKWWSPHFYQRVVDHFAGSIQFIQCGEKQHWHPGLKGVINLVGKTSVRQLIRLIYHCDGVISPVTFAMHLAAAVPTKTARLRPCVVIAGGREPPHWEAYPGHQFLHTVGMISCCASGGCWKSRCQTVGDNDRKDKEDVCERPVRISDTLRIPQCMNMITPEDVIRAVERYLLLDSSLG